MLETFVFGPRCSAAGAAGTGLPFPPRNETLTFYESLETTYRDTLLRTQITPGYVDAEGVAVWFPEWLRYVLHSCTAPEATTRVLMQIRGQGIQPVCEDLAPEPVAFPPRNLSLDFLPQLDAFYRDALARPVTWSHFDQEGKADWLQEYLRYRVDGQSDTDAQNQVFTQIDDAASPQIAPSSRVVVDILSPRGVTLPVVVLSPPASPQAAVILLEGGDGIIELSGSIDDPQIDSPGFLARNADAFAAAGLLVALVGVPSDYETGIDINYRISSQQSNDIASVVTWLDARSSIPVWVLGMSLGSYSATNSAIRLNDIIDGFAVCSASTAPTGGPYPQGILDMDLTAITMPAVIVGHHDDTCPGTPPDGVSALAEALTSSSPIVHQLFSGGLPGRSDTCGPTSAHGYFGIDEEVVAFMAGAIR